MCPPLLAECPFPTAGNCTAASQRAVAIRLCPEDFPENDPCQSQREGTPSIEALDMTGFPD
jgi:hypothetical protein